MTARALCRAVRERGLVTAWDAAPGLGALLCTGADAAVFLQSQLTSDVSTLAPGDGQLSARVDRLGRLHAWFSLHRLPDRGQLHPLYLLLLPRREATALRAALLDAAVDEDLLIDDLSDELAGVLVQGPAVDAGGPEYAVRDAGDAAPRGAWRIVRSFTGDPGHLLLWFGACDEQTAALKALRRDAVELDASPPAQAVWDSLLLEAGRPVLGRDLQPGERILPQTGLTDETVSATKGCYLGQEIIARVRAHGSPPEALRVLVFAANAEVAPPPAGAPLHAATGERLGTWGGAGWSAVREAPAVFAFLKRDHGAPGARLDLALADGVATAEVALPPLYRCTDAAARARHLYERAVARFGAGDDAGAVALLEQSLQLAPAEPDALEALGVILGRLARHAEAVQVFERLEKAAPAEPMVHVNLSLLHMKLGNRAEAERQKTLATMKRFGVTESDGDETATRRAAQESEARRKLALFEEVLAFEPDDPLALMGAGEALVVLGEAAAAEDRLGRARRAQPENSALYLKHGRVLEALERGAEAAAVYAAGAAVAARRGDLQPLREMEHRLLVLRARGDAAG